jgi:CBS domain-containing protein
MPILIQVNFLSVFYHGSNVLLVFQSKIGTRKGGPIRMPYIDELLNDDDLSAFLDNERLFTVLSTETIEQLHPHSPITLYSDATLDEAVRRMHDCQVGAIIVVENHKPVGIVTERDVLQKVTTGHLDTTRILVRTIMTPNPGTLRKSDQLVYALNLMIVGGYRHIPIVDEQGYLKGIISVKDILQHMVRLMDAEAEVYNLPPEPRHSGFASVEGG